MEAIKVFSSAIGYLKDQMLINCRRQLTGIEESDIMWVLTVPAIWDDKSKQLMRETAEEVYLFLYYFLSKTLLDFAIMISS